MRIIGGKASGRRLATVPRHRGLRPTTDRIRETLFAILTARWDLSGVDVLDLYAGTGALGCEALSRGARSALFVEHHRSCARIIIENLRRIDQPRQEIVQREVLTALAMFDTPRFDIVFLDPPYDDRLVVPTLISLDKSAALCPEATVIAEHSKDEPLPEPGALTRLKHTTTRTYGDTCLSFWELPPDKEDPESP